MCNLNILINATKGGLKTNQVYSFLNAVTTQSYSANPHGDGAYFSKGDLLIKSEGKLKYDTVIQNLRFSKFIITHQRLATSGHSKDYTQPFENENFVFAHNGVMSSYAKDGHSDTFVLFDLFNKSFNNSEKDRQDAIVDAINELFRDELGSWSIAIYDKIQKVLYYFKDGFTKIHLARNKEKTLFYITTKEDNLTQFSQICNEPIKKTLQPYILYKFKVKKDRISYYQITKLKSRTQTKLKEFTSYNRTKDFSHLTDRECYNETPALRMMDASDKCYYCDRKTFFYHKSLNRNICQSCFNENQKWIEDECYWLTSMVGGI